MLNEPDHLLLGHRKGLGLSFQESHYLKRIHCSVSVLKITITAFSADFIFIIISLKITKNITPSCNLFLSH